MKVIGKQKEEVLLKDMPAGTLFRVTYSRMHKEGCHGMITADSFGGKKTIIFDHHSHGRPHEDSLGIILNKITLTN